MDDGNVDMARNGDVYGEELQPKKKSLLGYL